MEHSPPPVRGITQSRVAGMRRDSLAGGSRGMVVSGSPHVPLPYSQKHESHLWEDQHCVLHPNLEPIQPPGGVGLGPERCYGLPGPVTESSRPSHCSYCSPWVLCPIRASCVYDGLAETGWV